MQCPGDRVDTWPIDRVRAAIENHTGRLARQTGREWKLLCPSHPDREPSLNLRESDEHVVLMVCRAACDNRDVLAAVGLGLRDLYPIDPTNRSQDPVVATYPYVDEEGALIYQVQRTVNKKFRQRRPDPDRPGKWLYNLDGVRRVLYRLPLVVQAAHESRRVWVVEGEKDVHTLESQGEVATCNPGGAGKWRPEYTEYLRGAHVIVVADQDRPGTTGKVAGVEHARQIALDLLRIGVLPDLVGPAVGKDITDHVLAGLSLDDLVTIPIQMGTEPPQADGSQTKAIDDTNGSSPDPAEPPLEQPPARQVRLTPASAFGIKAVRWVWADRMPLGELCLIAGREGVGKSTFLAWMAAAVTNGNLEGIWHGKRKTVLIAAHEDAWSYTIAPRLLAAGANLDMVYRVDVVTDEGIAGLNLPKDCRELEKVAREHDAAMLMCDPILSMVDETINVNKAQELRRALQPLKHLAENADLAIPALVHFNKTQGIDVLSMVAGSRAWTEIARAVISIAQDSNAEQYTCVVSQEKNNLGRSNLDDVAYTILDTVLEADDGAEARVGRLSWIGASEVSASQLLSRPHGRRDDGSAADYILDVLDDSDRAMSPRDIHDTLESQGGAAAKVAYNTVKQRLFHLARQGKVEKVGTGLYKAAVTTTPEDSSTPVDDLRAATRAGSPQGVTVTVTPQGERGWETVMGGSGVTGYGYDLGGEEARNRSNGSRQGSCGKCHGPMDIVEPGQKYHPTCDPEPPLVSDENPG